MLEAESERDVRATAATIPSSAVAVPASLHASLMSRLDRLGHAKQVAQIAAAIGREFSHALLAPVVRKRSLAAASMPASAISLRAFAVSQAATQAKAFELFAAVGGVDVEAIDALPHRSAITPHSQAGVRFFY